VAIAPTDEEIEALSNRPNDPLIAAVASALIKMTKGDDPEIARISLRELHSAIR
jgi:hypothetical protein